MSVLPPALAESIARVLDAEEHNQLETLYHARECDGNPGGPYEWQEDFHNKGSEFPHRAILAGNRVGKSRTVAAEIAIHATGMYPSWWRGRRFNKPTITTACGVTNEEIRNVIQKQLVGDVEDDGTRKVLTGTGWIPKGMITSFGFRQCGVPNVLDSVRCIHAPTGKKSMIQFKSFEQGALKFQGFDTDILWFDEEPEDQDIFSEAITRLASTKGIFLFSRTPLLGQTRVVQHFLERKPGTWFVAVGWDEAPHLDAKMQLELKEAYPEHERDTRTKGVPMMGTGAVYPVPDEMMLVEPFEIPAHYRRICGIDFGIEHKGAAAWIAYDADTDIAYLYDCYGQSGQASEWHAAAIRARGPWIPVSWPHDGIARDKGGGPALMQRYLDAGVNMLGVSARYEEDRGGGQPREPATLDLLGRMQTGRFKVLDLPPCREFLKEKRMLHRKDARIVPVNDDIESAVRYAMMMRRYAVAQSEVSSSRPLHTSADYDPLGAR